MAACGDRSDLMVSTLMRNRRAFVVGLASMALLSACAAGDALPSSKQAESSSASEAPSTSPTAADVMPTLAASPMAGVSVIPHEPTGPVIDGEPVSDEFDDGTFRLVLTVGQDRYRAGQLIDVNATVTYLGPADSWIVRGSESGLVGFGINSASLPVQISPGFTSACSRYEFTRGVPVDFPFSKLNGSGGPYTLDEFYRAYLSSDELRLPVGSWTITAAGSIGACGDEYHELWASVRVEVEP
jgi:hypothetical protein